MYLMFPSLEFSVGMKISLYHHNHVTIIIANDHLFIIFFCLQNYQFLLSFTLNIGFISLIRLHAD